MTEESDNAASMNNEKDNFVSEVIEEIAGSEKENQEKSRNEIVEKMLKEILEKQKNFETSFVDELRSVKSELQIIRDEMKPKTVIAAVPVKADLDSKNESVSMSTTGKYFVLKYVFKNVSSLKEYVDQWSEAEEHFGFKWRMGVRRTKEHLQFYSKYSKPMDTVNWTIVAHKKAVFISNRVENKVKECTSIFINRSSTSGWSPFIEWGVLKRDFLVDDKLTAEVHIKVGKTTGVYKEDLRSFDETMEEFSDVVLVVNKEKFYVSKLYLAAHSPYFKALFLGRFNESKETEIKLTGIDSDDFQKYIEVLYGESAIDEFTVEGILMVADMYDTQLVIRKCEQFLLEKPKKTLKKKLQMSMKYHLEALNKQCRKEIKSVADIKSVLPGDIRDLDPSITTEFLEIALSV